MNPLKADKVQFGFLDNSPHITRGVASTLNFYDPNIGAVSLSKLISERGLDGFASVSKSLVGSDYNTIQNAIDSLPSEGGLVVIYEGVYSEALTITKPVVMLARGNVSIEATDTSCISVSDASIYLDGVGLVIKSFLGNSNPSVISHTSVGVEELVFRGCSFDISNHANAEFIVASKGDVRLSDCSFTGTGKLDISSASSFVALGVSVLPELELTNMISQSYISATQSSEITLVASSLTLEGRYISCLGDNASSLTKNQVIGSRDFVAEAVVDITFPCPLSTTEYMVVFEGNTQKELPVVSNKTVEGFRVTFANPLNETVRWSIFM